MKKVTAKDLLDAFHDGSAINNLFGQQLLETLRYYDNMAGEKFRAPNLGNATPAFMVDELGEIQSEIKPRQTYEKVLKEVLKAHRPESLLIEGENYSASFKWVSKMIMDGDAIKEFVSDSVAFINKLGHQPTLADFQKLSEYWEIRTAKKNPGA